MFNHYVSQQVDDAYRASREREAALDQQLKQIGSSAEQLPLRTQVLALFAELRRFRPVYSEAGEQRITGNLLDEPGR